jgi:hypothetical protein
MPIDTREPHLVVSDSRGFRVEWGGDGQDFSDEEVLKKLEHMRDTLRYLGMFADITLHITAPLPLTIEQRAMILCELWYECEGAPTQEQWNCVLEDMFAASCHAAQQRGEPIPMKPDFPPIPLYAKGGVITHLRPIEGGRFPQGGQFADDQEGRGTGEGSEAQEPDAEPKETCCWNEEGDK